MKNREMKESNTVEEEHGWWVLQNSSSCWTWEKFWKWGNKTPLSANIFLVTMKPKSLEVVKENSCCQMETEEAKIQVERKKERKKMKIMNGVVLKVSKSGIYTCISMEEVNLVTEFKELLLFWWWWWCNEIFQNNTNKDKTKKQRHHFYYIIFIFLIFLFLKICFFNWIK